MNADRKETVRGLAHAAITVRDMEGSLKFYQVVFGAKKIMDIEEPKGTPLIEYLQFPDGTCLELFYPRKETPLGHQLGRNHLAFYTDDMEACYKRLCEYQVAVPAPPKTARDGNRQLWCTDPNGYQVELIEYVEGCPQRKPQEIRHLS